MEIQEVVILLLLFCKSRALQTLVLQSPQAQQEPDVGASRSMVKTAVKYHPYKGQGDNRTR